MISKDITEPHVDPGVTECAVDKRAIFAMEDLAVALPSPTTVEIVPILVCWRIR
jgi:hypothetical protein